MGTSALGNIYTTLTDETKLEIVSQCFEHGPSLVVFITAIDKVAFTGRVVCIGYAKTEIAFETKYFVHKELDIRGS